MSPEFLQTFGVLAIGLGFVLIGLGGISTYHASALLQHRAEIRQVEQKGEMNAQIMSLQIKNLELQQKTAEPPPPPPTAASPQPPPGTTYFSPVAPPPPAVTEQQQAAPTHTLQHNGYNASQPATERSIAPDPTPTVYAGVPPPRPPRTAPPIIGEASQPAPESQQPAWQEPSSLDAPGKYLSGRQRQVIADTLRAHGRHTVTIESSYGDEISRAFAEELGESFAEADWVVRGVDPHRGLPLASGVTVSAASFPPKQETRAVYEALLSAGIAVTQQLDPKQHSSETVVLVGIPL